MKIDRVDKRHAKTTWQRRQGVDKSKAQGGQQLKLIYRTTKDRQRQTNKDNGKDVRVRDRFMVMVRVRV